MTFTRNGPVTLFTNGTEYLRTATAAELAANNSGGLVRDAGGTMRPAGFNALPTLTAGSARTIVAGDNGGKFRITGGTAMTVPTGLATDFTMVIQNNSGSNKTLTASGVTLNWFSGYSVTTGNRTLANGAWVTITQRGATNVFDVAGAGIS